MSFVDRTLNIDGGRVGFLLVHGLGGTPVELRYVANGLARAGHTVHCPQLAGHGGSPEALTRSTWMDWYRSVEEAHARLKQTCDVIIVGGISAGPILALLLAARHPRDVHGLALFSPTLYPNGFTIPRSLYLFKLVHARWAARLFRFHERHPYGIKDERIRTFVLDSLQKDNGPMDFIFGRSGATLLEFRRLVRRVKKELGSIRQPALIIHPRDDDQSDLRNTFYIKRRLGGLVDTLVLDDSYHMITLDRQRQLVVDRTNAFALWLAGWVKDVPAAADVRRVANAKP